jgi:hypothetical protein
MMEMGRGSQEINLFALRFDPSPWSSEFSEPQFFPPFNSIEICGDL